MKNIDEKINNYVDDKIEKIYSKRHHIKFGVRITWLIIKAIIVLIFFCWCSTLLFGNY
jgi:hypothetical protein